MIADDTGLEADALEGQPGVKSARFAGINATMTENKALLLSRLHTSPNRKATFRCTLCYLDSAQSPLFIEATLDGVIVEQETDGAGFGYDGLFQVEGFDKTLSELKSESFSDTHRMRAFIKLKEMLSN